MIWNIFKTFTFTLLLILFFSASLHAETAETEKEEVMLESSSKKQTLYLCDPSNPDAFARCAKPNSVCFDCCNPPCEKERYISFFTISLIYFEGILGVLLSILFGIASILLAVCGYFTKKKHFYKSAGVSLILTVLIHGLRKLASSYLAYNSIL